MKHLEPKKTDVPSNPLTILTATELSEYLRVHPVTINRLVHSQIPAFRMGSEWRFDIGMIDRALEKSATQSAREFTSARSRASPLLGGGSAVSTDHPESATSVTIIAAGYRRHCAAPHCKNLGRMILRYNDAGGRPTKISEFCRTHTIARIARARAAGLKVCDQRKGSLIDCAS